MTVFLHFYLHDLEEIIRMSIFDYLTRMKDPLKASESFDFIIYQIDTLSELAKRAINQSLDHALYSCKQIFRDITQKLSASSS